MFNVRMSDCIVEDLISPGRKPSLTLVTFEFEFSFGALSSKGSSSSELHHHFRSCQHRAGSQDIRSQPHSRNISHAHDHQSSTAEVNLFLTFAIAQLRLRVTVRVLLCVSCLHTQQNGIVVSCVSISRCCLSARL